MTECTIEKLFYYPVKGCKAVEVESVELGPTGISGDRGYLILRDGDFANLKSVPELSRISVKLEGDGLRFVAPGCEDLLHIRATEGNEIDLQFYADQITVMDQGDSIAKWLSEVTGNQLRLATVTGCFTRNLPYDILQLAHGLEQDGFCDLSPILLVNGATLDEVNRQLSADIPVERFRCNIVVRGLEAFAEDAIKNYHCGDLTLSHVAACERCVIINTDHVTGEMNKEPLQLLHQTRRIKKGYSSGVRFGNYFNVSGPAKLSVGDHFIVGK